MKRVAVMMLVSGAMMVPLVSCDSNDDPIDDAIEDISDGVDDAVDGVKDAVDEVTEDLDDGIE